MFNLSEVARHMEEPKTPSRPKKVNEAFSHQLKKHTPSAKVPGRSVLHDRNRSHERKASTSTESLRLSAQKLPKETCEFKKLASAKQIKASRNLQKSLTPKDQLKKAPPQVLSERQHSPSIGAPKKRDLDKFMQTSMKYGEKIAKIMEASSISPKKQDRPKITKPDIEEFNLTDAMQKAILSETKSVYAQVRELCKQQKFKRRNSVGPDSGNTTERPTMYNLSNSGLTTQRSEEEKLDFRRMHHSLKRLSRRMKTSI
mmetsp:Transcript_28778/g.51206  ORF Transcript_28778/g.51206 Transcript_28778/m.51206 type:complete len:257 (+) Transcript_28778:32-802(+)|eukprot:CAMPEP_0204900732 /NCGR_PEP_ID=MMETSP1397-20131031/2651_1 /ASSEMBLY_ACC=CAM_ASM_000891 /TAXON_ID=49980 /ORGANISM="Climacostomum Climacostomum virens, Strain Stock W-24" /LENGTH=256 /DNA_ID=CAMNT_0052068941 /DNA_START=1 /DNA_END=771 /DNA_ORIENTATION=-